MFCDFRLINDGGRREDDWTCPSFGNVNISFRTTCNMHNCTQPKPADHNSVVVEDWTCPSCGNVNFSFRTTCNMLNCTQPRPADHNSKGYKIYGCKCERPYDGSACHYNYNSPLPGGNPYCPLQLSATPAYSGGPIIGTGALYGLPQLMEQFGLRLPIAQAAMGPRPVFPEEPSQKKDGT